MANDIVSGSVSALAGMGTSNAAQAASAKKSTGKSDFGSIMSSSLASRASANAGNSQTNVNTAIKSPKKVQGSNQNSEVNTPKNPDSKLNSSSVKSTAVNQSQDNSNVDKIAGALNEIKEQIKNVLDISDDEFEAAMEALGFTMQDLLKANNLTALVAQITGTDGALALITDTNLSDQLKQILDFVSVKTDELAQSMNMTVDELTDYINANADNPAFTDALAGALEAKAADSKDNTDNAGRDVTAEDGSQTWQNGTHDNLAAKITVENTASDNNASQDKDFTRHSDAKADLSENSTGIAANLTQSINDSFGEVLVENAGQVDAADIVQQIIDSVKVVSTESLQSMEIQLTPENLGKIHLTVSSRDGIMTAQIAAQDEAVKKAIENQLAVLKENFNNQGLKVEHVEVTVESHAFEGNQNPADGSRQNQESGRRRTLNLDSLMGLSEEELSDEEQQVMDMLVGDNSSVSYTA
ncbi:MAG: flagellar hook-length control protein FliK [[Bacteroides] pectinophilus]|nr:flagellar hook-length control protein FliK [[Bacteroides] pectinophilus]